MKIPWLALAIGLLVYLISGSIIAGVAVFVGAQIIVLLLALALVLIAAVAADGKVKR